MKKILVFLLLLQSSFTMSQSILVFKSGKVSTIDKQGLVYDLDQFILPYEVQVISGRYLIDDNREIRTIDLNGIMYTKSLEDKIPSSIEVKGDNYFISKRGKIYTVDEQGYLYEFEKEKEYRHVVLKGGNFFIAEKKLDKKKVLSLYVITNKGIIIEPKVAGLNISRINAAGGTYFTTTAGELFTVSAEGYVYSKNDAGRFNGRTFGLGHNYFIYQSNVYTVASNGFLTNTGPALQFGVVRTLGSTFFINAAKSLFSVSNSGEVIKVFKDQEAADISQMSQL